MTTITDSTLLADAAKLAGSVLLITGGANGIGRQTALDFAKYGAKVVIGDLDAGSAQTVVKEIQANGGQATSQKCDVTSWDDLVSLFKLAISTFSKVDVVIPCAGISDTQPFVPVRLADDGQTPLKPRLKTMDINIMAVMYTTHLAFHYLMLDVPKPVPFGLDPKEQPLVERPLKAIVLIGSIASLQGIPRAPEYSAAKHGIIGFMNGISVDCAIKGIRVGTICPFFAETAIVPIFAKIALAGIPKVPLWRISGAVIRCVTDPNPKTTLSLWTLPDGEEVFRLGAEELMLKEGPYKVMNARLLGVARQVGKVVSFVRVIKDLGKLVPKGTLLFLAAVSGIVFARQRGLINFNQFRG